MTRTHIASTLTEASAVSVWTAIMETDSVALVNVVLLFHVETEMESLVVNCRKIYISSAMLFLRMTLFTFMARCLRFLA